MRRRRRRARRSVSIALLAVALVVGIVVVSSGDDQGEVGRSVGLPSFVADPERRALAPVFERWAREYRVPLPLLEALAWRESQWDNLVRSDAGAIGIGQLLPETAAFVERELIGEPLDPADPHDNIRLTARYLRALIDRFDGKVITALAAYLQGSTSVAEDGVTAETAAYVRDVLELRDQFARARKRGRGQDG